jgi:hypothetical protein
MTSTIHGRAAIRARMSEWHRQHHDSDYGPPHYAFWNAKAEAERVRWFRQA